MSQVQFVTYDEAGVVTHVGVEDAAHFNTRLEAGERVLAVEGLFDPLRMRVDLATLTLQPKEIPHADA